MWSIKDARVRLERLMGERAVGRPSGSPSSATCSSCSLPHEDGKTVLASSFGATLEMAREGHVELRQDGPFEPIYMRPRAARCRVAARRLVVKPVASPESQ